MNAWTGLGPCVVQTHHILGFIDPRCLLAILPADAAVAWLDSARSGDGLGAWSMFCFDPCWELRGEGTGCSAGAPGELRPTGCTLLDELSRTLARLDRSAPPGTRPLRAGFVGYLGYELLHQLEQVDAPRGNQDAPDAHLMLYRAVLSWRPSDSQVRLDVLGVGASAAEAARDARDAEARARRWIADARRAEPLVGQEHLAEAVGRARSMHPRADLARLEERGVELAMSRSDYMGAIQASKEQIAAGNAFEICLTQPLTWRARADGRALYEVLRAVSPAPMASYLRGEGFEVLSASPERFLCVDGEGWVESRPIKGTRPRVGDPEADARWAASLSNHAKDRAENLMIVDLVRNDLGRVCALGSVSVPSLCAVEAHSHTWQLVSTVRGQLRDGLTGVDAVASAFPGGSMTGAPKISAMHIIGQLEGRPRGVYSGAIGYFGLDGRVDLSIVIRTLVGCDEGWRYAVGGAITSDSDPEAEFQETLDKARALLWTADVALALGVAHRDR